MGRKDETAANLNAIQNAPEPVDRLNLLGRWIGAKMEEIHSAEQRIDKRLEHLGATEQSLRTLFEALRKQVADTHPVLKELAQLRANALTAVEQVVRTSQQKPAAPPPDPAIDAALEERLAEQIIACEEKLRRLSQQAEEALVSRAGKLDENLDANVNRVNHYLEHRLLAAQQDADALINRVSDQIRVVEGRVTEMARTVDIHAAEAITRLRNDFDSMVAPIHERLAVQVSEMETRLSTEMSTIEETMKAQLNGFYLHLDQTGITLQNQLEEIAGNFRKQAETALASSRQSVRQQIDAIEDEVRLAVRPILQTIDDRRNSAEKQSDAAIAGLEEAMKIRLGELRRSGETIIQMLEAQLIDKLKLLRPQAQTAIDAAEKHVGQRLQAALDNARAHVELSEQQLADRIEELRPRAAAALQTAKTDITQQIASLESEATVATGWIEQRLAQRIDELTYRARKTVTDQIRDLDDASEKVRRRENTDAQQPWKLT